MYISLDFSRATNIVTIHAVNVSIYTNKLKNYSLNITNCTFIYFCISFFYKR